MPGQNGELAGDGDPSYVYSLLACDALELMSQRAWVPAGVMGDLDEQPAHVAVSLFGEFSVVGPVGALVHARLYRTQNVSVPAPTGWRCSLTIGMRLVHEAPEERELGA